MEESGSLEVFFDELLDESCLFESESVFRDEELFILWKLLLTLELFGEGGESSVEGLELLFNMGEGLFVGQ